MDGGVHCDRPYNGHFCAQHVNAGVYGGIEGHITLEEVESEAGLEEKDGESCTRKEQEDARVVIEVRVVAEEIAEGYIVDCYNRGK